MWNNILFKIGYFTTGGSKSFMALSTKTIWREIQCILLARVLLKTLDC